MLPELQRDKRFVKPVTAFASKRNKSIKYLKDQLEILDTVNNSKALADAYVNEEKFDEAIELYKNCLEGPHADDTSVYEKLSCAYFFKNDLDETKKHLLKLIQLRGKRKYDDFDLLLAVTLERSGDIAGALKEYAEIIKSYSGEEAMCRYALLLKKEGRKNEANDIFSQILKNTKYATDHYKKSQKKWIKIAKEEID